MLVDVVCWHPFLFRIYPENPFKEKVLCLLLLAIKITGADVFNGKKLYYN